MVFAMRGEFSIGDLETGRLRPFQGRVDRCRSVIRRCRPSASTAGYRLQSLRDFS